MLPPRVASHALPGGVDRKRIICNTFPTITDRASIRDSLVALRHV
jgi:hypothetical protein